jgi:hypothetical protein
MKKYIVLSVNDNPDYLFHVPLVCWAWRKLGWEPIVFYYGYGSLLMQVGINTSNVYSSDLNILSLVNNFKSETITQVSRLYGACVADGYIMTADIDMLPLSDYWKPDFNKLTVWGRDLTEYHYPICYVGAPSETWREIMNINSTDYNEMIKRDLRQQKNMWVLDQDLITERINNSGFVPFRIDRGTDKRTGYPIGRIDRSNWRLDHNQFIDCHMFHDVHRNEASFKKTLDMIHTVWPKEDFKWWIEYYKEFKKLCQK